MAPLPKPVPIKPDLEAIDQSVREGAGLYDCWEASPVRFEDSESHTEEIINILFPGNPLLCCGKSRSIFATRRREVWRGRLAELSLIVPNPMLSVKGLTQEGELSEHTKSATARPVYQILDFDFAEFARDGKTETIFATLVRGWRADGIEIADACAALIFALGKMLPTLVLVCHTGGKSLHAWFRVFELSPGERKTFKRQAITLGADRALWCRSQFVRMPDGRRENGARQTVFYLDREAAVTDED
jgi:hypothetical protein